MKYRLLAVAAITSAFALSFAANADISTYHGHGVVQSIDNSKHTITVKQDSVEDLGWPTRVMTYHLDGDKIAEGVKSGENIDFTFTADSAFNASVHYIHVTNS